VTKHIFGSNQIIECRPIPTFGLARILCAGH